MHLAHMVGLQRVGDSGGTPANSRTRNLAAYDRYLKSRYAYFWHEPAALGGSVCIL